jgi:hypothetical protein
LANVKKIFSSETAWPNGAKLGIDGPWVCPFQNCVRQPHPPFKMAAVFKGNDYLPLKFASVSFYCQVSENQAYNEENFKPKQRLYYSKLT